MSPPQVGGQQSSGTSKSPPTPARPVYSDPAHPSTHIPDDQPRGSSEIPDTNRHPHVQPVAAAGDTADPATVLGPEPQFPRALRRLCPVVATESLWLGWDLGPFQVVSHLSSETGSLFTPCVRVTSGDKRSQVVLGTRGQGRVVEREE